jgi:hypothetical protein
MTGGVKLVKEDRKAILVAILSTDGNVAEGVASSEGQWRGK